MYKLILVVACCFLAQGRLVAQDSRPMYHRVQILLEDRAISELGALGVSTDHGIYLRGHSLTAEISSAELEAVRAAGFKTVMLQENLQQWYLQRDKYEAGVSERSFMCQNEPTVRQYPIPGNYTYGSMGGYHTYAEMLAVLDSMYKKFPHLITQRALVSDTLRTHLGRPVYFVKISDHADQDEDEPEVLYTALHHAREANSLSQMLFFMWYLLENYETNEEVRYIVRNAELYFIPCINVDGYLYNESTDPKGGGFWRKNRRPNENGTFGVDLNRNYGYQWGAANGGSSGNPASEVYRGPSAFSEPETRMVRDFCLQHNFLFVQNYHTFSNLLIYPWAYNDQPADSVLVKYARLFVRENKYKSGTSSQTVGYAVNGSSDDWMYGALAALSFTPEVGTTGFWPAKSEIIELNRSTMWINLATVLSALHFGEITTQYNIIENRFAFDIPWQVVRYGRQFGNMTVSLISSSPAVISVSAPQTFPLALFEEKKGNFRVQLRPDTKAGEVIQLVLQLNNGFYSRTDTIEKIFTGGTIADVHYLVADQGNNTDLWNKEDAAEWGISDKYYVSPPSSITDSPQGNYTPPTFSLLTLKNPVILPAMAQSPRLRFFGRWEMEEDKAFVQVFAKDQNGVSTPLCGVYTEPGSIDQGIGQPVYDGMQSQWVEESMNLSPWKGQTLELSFYFFAGGEGQYDGFYFDDLRIEYFDPVTSSTVALPLDGYRLAQNHPNPAGDFTTVLIENTPEGFDDPVLMVTDLWGKVRHQQAVEAHPVAQSLRIDTRKWEPGVYIYYMEGADGRRTQVRKMVKN